MSRWPEHKVKRYGRATHLMEDWPDLGLRVSLILDNPKKYPAAWARAVEVMPDVRLLTLALPSEDNIEISPAGLTALVMFLVGDASVEYSIKVPWACVVDMRARTRTDVQADSAAKAERRATTPAVKFLQNIATVTNLLPPEELEETK